MQNNCQFYINKRRVALDAPPLFIADIAANHDGDLKRAKNLIKLAANAGAHVAKFQHFSAQTLVSDIGFRSLGSKLSHQAKWSKSVYEVYEAASVNLEWTQELADVCQKEGIAFMSTPYSIELAKHIDSFVEAYKIGSGDIDYIQLIEHVASTGKPWLIATGAASREDVQVAISAASKINPVGVIMQCNTNYTASAENFKYLNLNVLKTYENDFPNLILGLSDHTPGHSSIIAAIAMGARVFEKHFTDDTSRPGPDHAFSMDPLTWREMIQSSAQVFESLGDGVKRIEENERDTRILQRRAVRLNVDAGAGAVITRDMLTLLRPAPMDSIPPVRIGELIGKKLNKSVKEGEVVTWADIAL